jgi:hypothetical protein
LLHARLLTTFALPSVSGPCVILILYEAYTNAVHFRTFISLCIGLPAIHSLCKTLHFRSLFQYESVGEKFVKAAFNLCKAVDYLIRPKIWFCGVFLGTPVVLLLNLLFGIKICYSVVSMTSGVFGYTRHKHLRTFLFHSVLFNI